MLEWNVSDEDLRTLLKVLLGVLAGVALAVGILALRSPLGSSLTHLLDGLFALSTVQSMWYVTRAAGIIAYLLLWLSTAWGLAVTSKVLDPALPRAFTFDAHEFLSLLALGFTALHVLVLLADQYLPFSVAQILVPFASTYRPVWVGLGVIGLYLTILVSVTFYARRWIGAGAFRSIHYLSYVAYALVTLHAWFAGTDSALPATRWLYLSSALVIIFLTVYRSALALQPEA
jgi:predicted ferric reductase